MLRFLGKNLINQDDGINVHIISQCQVSDEEIWQNARECFRQNGERNPSVLQIVPIMDQQGEILCYGWQDMEANRELRMLKELNGIRNALQFSNIFPDIRKIIVCGCNELAYYFVKYLERFHIPVSVSGKYWEFLGYQNLTDIDDHIGQLLIHAEPVLEKTDLFQRVSGSASAGFECIDQIYEANVLAGKIMNCDGGLEKLLEKLEGKDIVILGTDERAQDAYDLLYQHHTDVRCFSEESAFGYVGHIPLGYAGYIPRVLLGKPVNTVWEAIRSGKDSIFIDVHGEKSALGTANVDFFDYYGYERNEQFFLMNDYTDIPCSNLVHVLKGKEVFLAGDGILCGILKEYLENIENQDILVRYIEISQWDMPENSSHILFVVHPWYGNADADSTLNLWNFREKLKKITNISYSEYFSHAGAFVLIDAFMHENCEKYTHECFIPKGILLGAMPWMSGNILIRGLLDGHPNILKGVMGTVNDNLFWYCVRLTWHKCMELEKISAKVSDFFPYCRVFQEIIEKACSSEETITSQEMFLLYHIENLKNMYNLTIKDMSQIIVYWEPHLFPRKEMPVLAKWLESRKIGGYTLVTRRNLAVWFGANFKSYSGTSLVPFLLISIKSMSGVDFRNEIPLRNWKTLIIRFEDLKLHPQEELQQLCDMIGIPWSDTLLHTTNNGSEWLWENSVVDFDIKPVFNPYEEYLSEFDRFRVLLVGAPYQKKYGYIYENCLKFSRAELQEMFLKKFRFQDLPEFETETDKVTYFLCAYDSLRQQLWETRKHMVLDDILPEFEVVEIGRSAAEEQRRKKSEENKKR